jgi:hypothetical protein
MSGTRIYKAWAQMKNRCSNVNDPGWANYGGRGITVCDRWQTFESFYADMGERPEGKTLDRIDNDGNYEPGNCRWATPSEQLSNRRTSLLLTLDGVTKTVTGWARSKGLRPGTILDRYRRGVRPPALWRSVPVSGVERVEVAS